MAVTIKDVEHIAELAKLEFSEEEKEMLTHQLNRILEYMEKLDTLDTESIEPLSHVIELSNIFRNDEVKPGVSTADALENAPSKTDRFFKVPKVIGEKS
jgi:aspartyl-tRNA(Asn)/glutamyl-tRNA(Gln) amidotransferase subunit C